MNIFVTGATGFTGGALVRRLLADGHHVRALVRNLDKAKDLADQGVELIEGDMTQPEAIMRGAEGCAIIYHIAAVFRTAGHSDQYYHDVNVTGVQHIIDAAKAHHVGRTVHCSTIGVHGHVSEIPSNEDSPFNPGDIYQTTKLAGEQLFQKAIEDGLDGTLFRPGSIYGPGDLRLLKLFKGVQKGRFPVFGDGKTTYHLAYIDDLVNGIVLCGTHPDPPRTPVILCGDGWIDLMSLINLVAAATDGHVPKIKWPIRPLIAAAWACETVCKPLGIDPPLYVRRCEFYVKSRAFTYEKAKRTLGYEPQVDTIEGVYRTACWYAEQGLMGPVVDRDTYYARVKDLPVTIRKAA